MRAVQIKRFSLLVLLLCVLCISVFGYPARFKHLLTVDGASAGDNFGCYIVGAGDWSGNGHIHFAVGIPGFDSDRGRVTIYYHDSATFGTATVAETIDGEAVGDKFGDGLSFMPDVSGDGLGELIVGAPDAASGKGKVYVIKGGGASLADTISVLTGPGAGAEMGEETSSAGDVNNDGYEDFIVSAHGVDSAIVYRYDNATSEFIRHKAHGGEVGSEFGRAVAGIGDVNSDGYDDYIIGAPELKDLVHTSNSSGGVFVFSGINDDTLWMERGEYVFNPPQPTASEPKFGSAVSSAGDYDNDGDLDVIVGAYSAPHIDPPGVIKTFYAGKTYVYTADSGQLLMSFQVIQSIGLRRLYAYSGYSVAGGTDFGFDGFSDIVIGCTANLDSDFPADVWRGRGVVMSGSNSTPDTLFFKFGTDNHIANTDEFKGGFGYDVNVLGDVDGDGRQDIGFGGFGVDKTGVDAGQIQVFTSYLAGDTDNNNKVNVLDLTYLVDYIHRGGPAPIPIEAGDILEDCVPADTLDLDCLVGFIYLGGPLPCLDTCSPGRAADDI